MIWNPRANDLFLRARDVPAGDARRALLDHECAADPALRAEVEALLAADDRAGGFLEPPAADPDATRTLNPAAHWAGAVVGRYKLVEPIGHGGMGEVWLAQQQEPVRRLVALKVVRAGMDSRTVLARFEAERQALALMDHPNIAKVLDGGTIEAVTPPRDAVAGPVATGLLGRPYFVMELVKGQTITRYCDDHRLAPKDRLGLFVQVCQAIQHAHQKGIIHRDLKPNNILVGLYDGRPVPKVIDFGVAKAAGQPLTEKTLVTGFGAVVGTPEYMSPEQATLDNQDIDTRTDVYALGVLLYELLTGTTPLTHRRVKDAALLEVLRVVREEDPPRPSTRLETTEELPTIAANRGLEPRSLSGLVRGELDWIVMKALEKDRARRYESANAFAADVQRYLTNEPVLACPPSAAYRLRKLARRHRVAVGVTTAVAGLLLAGTAVSTWQAFRAAGAERDAAGQRDRAVTNERLAEDRRREAEAAGEELRDTLYAARMNLVGAAWEADNVARVRELLGALVPAPGARDPRGFEWYYWDRLAHAEASAVRLPFAIPDSPYDFPQFSGDGTRLSAMATVGKDLELQVWDATTATRLFARPLPASPTRRFTHALAADGRHVAVIEASRGAAKPEPFVVRVYDVATGAEAGPVSFPAVGSEQAVFLAPNADGTRVLTLTGVIDRKTVAHDIPQFTTTLRVWDVAAGRAMLTVSLGSVRPGPALSPDGTRAAVITTLDGKTATTDVHGVKVWDVTTGKELYAVSTHGGEPFERVTFSPDGKLLAAAGTSAGGNGVWVWDAATGREVRAFGGRRAVGSIRFNPAGTRLASYDRRVATVALFDPVRGVEREVFKDHSAGVVGLAFSADGRRLRTLSYDGWIRTWPTGPADRPTRAGAAPAGISFTATAVSPDGTRVAEAAMFGPDAGRFEVREVDGPVVATIRPAGLELMAMEGGLALDRGGRRLAARENGVAVPRLWVYEVATGRELLSLAIPGLPLVALAPAGDRVAVPVADGPGVDRRRRCPIVRLLDVDGGRPPRDLPVGLDADLAAATFSPDGRFLATRAQALKDPPEARLLAGCIRLWDAADGRLLAELDRSAGSAGLYQGAAFSPDGALLVTARQVQDGGTGPVVLDVWETATGRKRFELRGHADRVSGICFSPDGRRIVSATTAGAESMAKVWDAATGRELTTLGCRGFVGSLAFSPDGHRLIAVRPAIPDTDPVLWVWDGRPREPVPLGAPGAP